MSDQVLIERMLLFLRGAHDDWTRLAEEAESVNNVEAEQRARSQEQHCRSEIARLTGDLAADAKRPPL